MLKLNKHIPWHTIRKERKRRKLTTDTVKRAMKFEEKVNKRKDEDL